MREGTDANSGRQVFKVVVISDCAPVDLAFIAELRSRFSDLTVIRTTGMSTEQQNTTIRKESLFLRLERRYSRCLVPSGTLNLFHKLPLCEISENALNGSQGRELLRSINPDVLITRRTCILKESLFSIPKLALNVHQGLAPQYRGNHTLFWALYNGDPSAVATTVHQLAPGIDDGDIYGIARPNIHPLKTEAALSIEMMKLAVDIIEQLLSKAVLEGRVPRGRKQCEKGKLYLEKHRTFRKNLLYFMYKK